MSIRNDIKEINFIFYLYHLNKNKNHVHRLYFVEENLQKNKKYNNKKFFNHFSAIFDVEKIILILWDFKALFFYFKVVKVIFENKVVVPYFHRFMLFYVW